MCLTSSARRLLVGFILLLALAAALQPPAGAKEKKVTKQERARIQEQIAELPPQYRVWLAQVAILITREEVATFLTLKENYQRDAFVGELPTRRLRRGLLEVPRYAARDRLQRVP